MAQFDVYPNPNPAYRKEYPWIVDVQHATLAAFRTRLTIPLSRASQQTQTSLPHRLFATIEFAGERLTLLPHLAASVHTGYLKNSAGSLAHYRSDIQAGLDALVAGV
ncbi:MAG: plasmid maintenance protein CcdB [Brachymonas sp.]|nr:plasmid maintenance protein CcdB [Brachymonas sp.]